jgi:hypothetical protein
MADLTANAPLKFKGEAKTETFILDTVDAQVVYKGEGIVIDQDVDAEYAHTARGKTLVTGDVVLGIAAEGISLPAGAQERFGVSSIEVYVEPTIIGFLVSQFGTFTNADLGKTMCLSDSGTLSVTPGAYPTIGKLFKVEDGYAYVQLVSPWVMTV